VAAVEKRIRKRGQGRWRRPARVLPQRAEKAIQKELGDEEGKDELAEIRGHKIQAPSSSKEAREKAQHENQRRPASDVAQSAEATVVAIFSNGSSPSLEQANPGQEDLKLAQEISTPIILVWRR